MAITTITEEPSAPGKRQHRRCWQRELLVFSTIAALTTLLFWLFPLDIVVSNWFATGSDGTSWPLASHQPWSTLNHGGDKFLTITLISLGFLVLIGNQLTEKSKLVRLYGLFILATLFLGPGLVVNAGFKDHLGRPRPVEIVNFGGNQEYVPPLHKGSAGGNSSFPSGHAASAFCYLVFWFIWRGSHPRLAGLALGGTLVLGTMMSFSRVAAGAHFLSDVIWSAYLCYLSSFVLYYFVLRIPLKQAKEQ